MRSKEKKMKNYVAMGEFLRGTTRKRMAAIGLAVILGMTGCAEKNGAPGNPQENVSAETENDTAKQANADDEGGGPTSQDVKSNLDAQSQSVDSGELDGDVLSVDGDSFVISRHETFTDEDAGVMVAVGPGNEEEADKVTVHVSENCVWEYKTVKNGGINPEDVSTREGSFADVKEGLMVTIQGSWQTDGSFLADSIEMFVFV